MEKILNQIEASIFCSRVENLEVMICLLLYDEIELYIKEHFML